MLSSGFALVPIVNLIKAHAGGHILTLDAIDHALVEGIARVCLQGHRQHWLYHYYSKYILNY
jgi:hypothetical protein